MSFVKTRDNGQGNLHNKVGSSYGERRELMQSPVRQAPVQRPAAPRPLDQFDTKKAPKGQPLSSFAPNAAFRKFNGATNAAGNPYKRSLHEHIEQGSAPVSSGAKMPSDRAILNFLDKVIASAPAQSRGRAKVNASVNSSHLKRVKPRPQNAAPKVRPTLPATGRPIPTIPARANRS